MSQNLYPSNKWSKEMKQEHSKGKTEINIRIERKMASIKIHRS